MRGMPLKQRICTWLVKFRAVGVYSMDYRVYASRDGNSEASYFAIGQLLQQARVHARSPESREIPFAQVTLHSTRPDHESFNGNE